jgi:DNA-binding GntR family transcriptional regulator|tara:strand:+ start:765 stop:965 length:201 start_codon:yes stop_codon:yes gene_type:complete
VTSQEKIRGAIVAYLAKLPKGDHPGQGRIAKHVGARPHEVREALLILAHDGTIQHPKGRERGWELA